jgi:hypothetical protein
MRTLLAVVVAAIAASGAGCGGGDAACGDGDRAARTSASRAGTAFLTGVAIERGDCARVSFAFEEAVPGYRVAYEPAETALVEDGSGRRIALPGEAFLVVWLEPATTAHVFDDGSLRQTYDGPRRFAGDPAVAKTGDFEGVVRWTIGLDEPRPFDVAVDGSRLTVAIG